MTEPANKQTQDGQIQSQTQQPPTAPCQADLVNLIMNGLLLAIVVLMGLYILRTRPTRAAAVNNDNRRGR